MTQKQKLVRLLTKGNTTPQQAAKAGINDFFGLISELRSEGVPVYTNKTNVGPCSHKYRIGKPSRLMIAAAYRAYGNQVFGVGARGQSGRA